MKTRALKAGDAAEIPEPVSGAWTRAGLILSLMFAVVIGYANTLANGFVWDDLIIIPPNSYLASPSLWPKLFLTDVHHFALDKSNFYRPLQMLSYALDRYVFGPRMWGYHFTNAALHGAAVFLVWLNGSEIIGRRTGERSFAAHWPAWGAALIWAAHPLHAQAVTYVSGRADILVAIGILAAHWFYLRGKIGLALTAFVAALLSKELAVVTPLILIASDRVLPGRERRPASGLWLRTGPFFLVLAVYVFLRLTVLNFPSAFSTDEIPGIGWRVLTAGKAVWILLADVIIPDNLRMIRNIDLVRSAADPLAWLGWAGIIALAAAAVRVRRKIPAVTFGLTWAAITGFPVFGFLPMNANVSEHWMYLPSAGLLWAGFSLAGGLARQRAFRPVFVTVCVGAALVLSAVLIQRNRHFRDERTLFTQLVRRHPNNARVTYNLGTVLAVNGDHRGAREMLERTIRVDPGYAQAYANLGLILFKEGRLAEAIEHYETAARLRPGLVDNHVNLGNAYQNTGRGEEAREIFEQALRWQPGHHGAMIGLGIEHAKAGDLDRAEALFRSVLSFDPGNVAARKNLERVHQIRESHVPGVSR